MKPLLSFNVLDIALQNRDKGPFVVMQDEHAQIAVMSVNPGDRIQREKHDALTQLFYIVQGQDVLVKIGDHEYAGRPGTIHMVPPGVYHEVQNNNSRVTLKLFTVYCKDEREKFAH